MHIRKRAINYKPNVYSFFKADVKSIYFNYKCPSAHMRNVMPKCRATVQL